jgi:hypothetical protein
MVCRVIQTARPGGISALFGTVNPIPHIAANRNGTPARRLPVVRLDPSTRTRSLDLSRPFMASPTDRRVDRKYPRTRGGFIQTARAAEADEHVTKARDGA